MREKKKKLGVYEGKGGKRGQEVKDNFYEQSNRVRRLRRMLRMDRCDRKLRDVGESEGIGLREDGPTQF